MNVHAKAEAWIFDASGTARHGWLEINDANGEMRPTDRGRLRVSGFPPETAFGAARLAMWADQRDKYVLRLDLGTIQRWVICERFPALLHTAASLSALVRLGRA